MDRPKKRQVAVLLAVVAAMLASGCSSRSYLIAPEARPGAEVLGPVQAEACGLYLLGFISIGANHRIERAHRSALAAARGARALQKVEISERWLVVPVIGTQWCATVKGIAIR